MAPLTPFFTEVLYQNLRKVCKGSEESIHYCSYPEVEGKVHMISYFFLPFIKYEVQSFAIFSGSSLFHECLKSFQRWERIEQSVNRMMTIIDLARNIRERHNKPLKTPLRLSLCTFLFPHPHRTKSKSSCWSGLLSGKWWLYIQIQNSLMILRANLERSVMVLALHAFPF